VDASSLRYAAENIKAPMYIFDIDMMQDTVMEFKRKLEDKSGLCFAIKANPFLIKEMEKLVDRIEVCSMGEFRICKKLGIAPEKLFISGVLKKKEDINEILEYCHGKCRYTAESPIQFSYFVNWCETHTEDEIRVYPRLSSGNQFGMDEETIIDLIKLSEVYPNLKVEGIHFFSGTQKKKVSKIAKELEKLKVFYDRIEEEVGYQIEELEYGSGLAFPYFEGQEDKRKSDLDGMAKAIVDSGFSKRVTVEMGRALCANCGYYLTNVLDMKTIGEKNYCIVDGGMQHINYDGQIRGMYIPKFSVTSNQEEGQATNWIVCGALCTPNDVLLANVSISNLQLGDVFIFENTGAYAMTEGMSLFLSHALPKVATYSKETGFKMHRDKQSTYVFNCTSDKYLEEDEMDILNNVYDKVGVADNTYL